MKNKSLPLYMLSFAYAIFSFAVYMPEQKMNVYDWIRALAFNAVFNIVFVLVTDNRKLAYWAQCIIMVYLVFLFSVQINKMYRYIQLYHNRNNEVSVLIMTMIFILIFVVFSKIEISKFSMPLFIFSRAILAILLILNMDKVSVYNLCSHPRLVKNNDISSVTMFDYINPMILISKNQRDYNKKSLVEYQFLSNIGFIIITLAIFACFRGDYMYSISPLQVGFQITTTNFVRNFDGLFTFLLIFAYFAALLMILWAFKEISVKYKYRFLLLAPLFVIISLNFDTKLFLVLQLIAIIVLLAGRCKSETS